MTQGCSTQQAETRPVHHTEDGKFRNHYPFIRPVYSDLMKWRQEHSKLAIPPLESYQFPLAENDPVYLKANRTHDTLTWVGHATVLAQINGINILTDPHFSKRVPRFHGLSLGNVFLNGRTPG